MNPTPRLFDDGKPPRAYAAEAITKACRGEDAKAYLDQVEPYAKRELAKALARASFALIQFHARTAARTHPADTERYIQKRVPPALQHVVHTYTHTLRERAGKG